MKKYIIAIDECTTGIRAMIFDHDGAIVSHAYEELSQVYSH